MSAAPQTTPPPADWAVARNLRLARRLDGLRVDTAHGRGLIREGVLRRAVGLTLEAVGCEAPLGASCKVEVVDGGWVDAEVVGFAGERTYLMPSAELHGLLPNARVVPSARGAAWKWAKACWAASSTATACRWTARGRSAPKATSAWPACRSTRWRVNRSPSRWTWACARSTRCCRSAAASVGLFAGSGVGKSTLLGMMTRYTAADVIVVGLIGERGREVRDFVETTLGEEGLRRAVVVASPADRPPLARLHGAYRATAIAEWFRDQGLNVLLLMDSLTRFAQAQREIGLSVGEPPTTRGYPPSVFAKLPALVERAGNGAKGRGSITAFYTVLTEGDDPQDPIADAARAILDGHILLSRRVADSGLYPAIDVESSVSRVVTEIADEPWRLRIRKLKRLVSAYSANRDLIAIGAYQRGNDAATDEALERWPEIMEFLGQDVAKAADLPHSQAALQRLVEQES